jgi:hypothetical protein
VYGPERRGENNVKMDHKEIVRKGVVWIDLAQDRDKWRVVVNLVTWSHNRGLHNVLGILD